MRQRIDSARIRVREVYGVAGTAAMVVLVLAPAPVAAWPAARADDEQALRVSYVCPAAGAAVDRWSVYNPNEFVVAFAWELIGSAQAGSGAAGPGSHAIVETEPIPGRNVLRVLRSGELVRAVPATEVCLAPGGLETGTLRIRPVLASDYGPEDDTPAGAGVHVRLDGEEVGVTGDAGIVEATVAPGAYGVEAVIPSMALARLIVDVAAGATADVTARMLSGKPVTEPADLHLDGLVNDALPLDVSAITLRFHRDGRPIRVTAVYAVEVTNWLGDGPADLTRAFEVTAEGTIVARDVAPVLGAFAAIPTRATLRVMAEDERGLSYHESISFIPGVHRVAVRLEAPPSRPDLPTGEIAVRVRFASGSAAETMADGAGGVLLPYVPAGTLHIEARTELDGLGYIGLADIAVRNDVTVTIRMLGPDDVMAGVRPWSVTPGTRPER